MEFTPVACNPAVAGLIFPLHSFLQRPSAGDLVVNVALVEQAMLLRQHCCVFPVTPSTQTM